MALRNPSQHRPRTSVAVVQRRFERQRAAPRRQTSRQPRPTAAASTVRTTSMQGWSCDCHGPPPGRSAGRITLLALVAADDTAMGWRCRRRAGHRPGPEYVRVHGVNHSVAPAAVGRIRRRDGATASSLRRRRQASPEGGVVQLDRPQGGPARSTFSGFEHSRVCALRSSRATHAWSCPWTLCPLVVVPSYLGKGWELNNIHITNDMNGVSLPAGSRPEA